MWPFEVVRAVTSPADAAKRRQVAASAGQLDGFGVTQLKVAGKSVYSTDKASSATVLIASLAVAGAFLIVAISILIWWWKKRSLQSMYVGSVVPARRGSVFNSVFSSAADTVASRGGPVSRAPVHANTSFKFHEIDPSHLSSIADVAPDVQHCQWSGINVVLKRAAMSPHVHVDASIFISDHFYKVIKRRLLQPLRALPGAYIEWCSCLHLS